MTDYKLEDFKEWLAEKPEREAGLSWAANYDRLSPDKIFTRFIQTGFNGHVSWQPFHKVTRQWITERERERERERNNMKLEELKTWLNDDPTRKNNLPNWEEYLAIIETKNPELNSLKFFIYSDYLDAISQEEQKEYIKVIEEWMKHNEQPSEVEQLKIELQTEKDKVANLEAELQELLRQLESIKSELSLTPATPHPEKQTTREKINYFNSWIRKNKQEREELKENIKKEQKKSQDIRNSLSDLEQKLKSNETNLQQISQLSQQNSQLQAQIKDLESNLDSQKDRTQKSQQENQDLKQQLDASQLAYQELQDQNQKPTSYKEYLKWGAIIAVLAGIGYFGYKLLR